MLTKLPPHGCQFRFIILEEIITLPLIVHPKPRSYGVECFNPRYLFFLFQGTIFESNYNPTQVAEGIGSFPNLGAIFVVDDGTIKAESNLFFIFHF
jgi:hypothetical protein